MSSAGSLGPQALNSPPQLVRRLLNRRSSIDPVFSVDEHGTLMFSGLHIRAHNDAVPLRFAPGETIGQQSLEAGRIERPGALCFGPGQARQTPLTTLAVPLSGGGTIELSFPLVTEDDAGGEYFNWRLRPAGIMGGPILEIDRAKSMILLNPETIPGGRPEPLSREGLNIVLRAGASFALFTSGTTSDFLIGFTCVGVQPEAVAISVRMGEGSTAKLEVKGETLVEVSFAVFVHPYGERLLAGAPTFSLTPSRLAAAIFDPFQFRVMNWLFCMPTAYDVPLTDPVLAPPNLEQVFVTFGVDQGLIVPRTSNVRGWFDAAQALVMAGNPPEALLDKTIAGDRWRCVTLLSTSPQLVDHALAIKGGTPGIDPDQPTVRWSKVADATFIGAVVDPDAPSHAVMEAAAAACAEAVRAGEAVATPEMEERSAALRRAQRPALPYNADLVVAMVSVAGNMARGRLPQDDGSLTPNYSVYARDDLWLIPWNPAVGADRSRLLVELNLRLASEWLASRACVELYGKGTWTAAGTADVEAATSAIRRDFREWLPKGLSPERRAQPADDRAARVAQAGITPSAALRTVAQAAYEACSATSEYSGFDASAEGLSFANPCVLVLTSGGSEEMDLDLNASIGYWASVAGRSTGVKGGVVVPTLLAPGALDELHGLQVAIRKAVVKGGDSPAARSSVAAARARLGLALGERLEPATGILLAKLNPDRVIIFSGIVFDSLPFGRSIFGLEKPSCRLPVQGQASQYIAQMVAASRRSLRPSWRRRAAIVTAPQIDDDVTAWALEVSSFLEDELARVGQACVYPAQPGATLASVLDSLNACSMVFFIGHGEASENAAALDIGIGAIDIDTLRERDWSDKFICLIGCETAAIDASDMASAFLAGGARAVIGTLTLIRVDVARVFFGALLRYSAEGRLPLDYAFFSARCETALYEVLLGTGSPFGDATGAEAAALFIRHNRDFAAALDELGLLWPAVQEDLLFSLSLTLLGGASEMLV